MRKQFLFFICITLITLCLGLTSCGKNNYSEQFIGTWQEVLNPTRSVTITKTDAGFDWQDKEGTYPAVIKNNTLLVESGDITAKVSYNSKKDTLTAEYGNARVNFQRETVNSSVEIPQVHIYGLFLCKRKNRRIFGYT